MDKLQLSSLLSVYGKLLTEKQRLALTMYCDCDCTLQEIADETDISKQGVRDAIVNGEKSLKSFEDNLHLAEFYGKLLVAVESDDKEQIKQICKQFLNKES